MTEGIDNKVSTPTVYEASQSNISIRHYMERVCEERSKRVITRITGMEELHKQRFEMQDNALRLATEALEIRLEKLNELRSEVLQDRARYITIDRANAENKALEARITLMIERNESDNKAIEGRIKALEMWQSKMYGAGLAIALLGGISGGAVAKLLGL